DVERVALAVARDALRRREVEDGIAAGAEGNALVGGRQKAGGPVGRAATRAAWAGLQHHEAGQVLRRAADAVRHPRAHARTAELRRAGVDEDLRRPVVEDVGRHRAHDGEVIDNRRRVRQTFRYPGAVLAVASKLADGRQQFRLLLGEAVHEGEALALDELVRDRL